MVKIIAISDTHGMHDQLSIPDGDILVHSGDLSNHGRLEEVQSFNAFLGTQPHKHKVVVAGNHDYCFEEAPEEAQGLITNAIYLQDEAIEVMGLNFYGSPWTPWFFDWAFNLHRGAEIKEKWDLIPQGLDMLVTHGPPRGIGDRMMDGEEIGCDDLRAAIERAKPKFHICGHVHEGYGVRQEFGVTFVNASIANYRYLITNPATVIEYNVEK
ncbi:metallophosphatase domain-containing protein [Chloroflexota bacterium]